MKNSTTALIAATAVLTASLLGALSSRAAVITWDEGQQTTNDDSTTAGTSYSTAYTVAAQGLNAEAYVAINGEVGSNLDRVEARSSGLLTMWQQSNNPTADGYAVMAFENTSGSGPTLSSFSANIDERFPLTGRDSEYAWFIETSSGTFATDFTVFNNPADNVSLANASAATWYTFDAANSLGDATIGTAGSPEFGDIVAAGMFFRFGLDNDAHNGNIGPRINSFTATLSVPEPSTLALLGLGAVVLRCSRRRLVRA